MAAKRIMITGATSGIGLALLEQYAHQGDAVIACGRNLKKLSHVKKYADEICLFDVNVADEVEMATQSIQGIDILILNAGDCQYIDDVKHFNGKLFADIIHTNLSSLGYMLACFLPKMNQFGQVIFISSIATQLPFPRTQAYGASKAGMDYLANSLRLDLASSSIDVTLVHPGFVKTPLTDKNTFNMPFLISSTEAAKRIIAGVEQRKTYLHFPKRLTWLLKFFSFLPSSVWQAMIMRGQKS